MAGKRRWYAVSPLLRPLMKSGGASQAAAQARRSLDVQDFSPDYLASQIAGSKARLRLPRLPVFLLHDPRLADLAQPGLAAFLGGLVPSGRPRAWAFR
jgi:aryl-alcohol dehydrogenase-like predicted oxidoreductase